MLVKLLSLICLSFSLISCNVAKNVKNIIELTPRLSKNSDEPILLNGERVSESIKVDGDIFVLMKGSKQFFSSKNNIISSPAYDNGVFYIADNKGIVTAVNESDGQILWTQNISDRSQNHYEGGGVVLSKNKVYITNGSRFLTILDRNNGNQILRKEFSDTIKFKPLVFGENVVLIQTVSNQLFAYDITSSALIWQHEGIFEPLISSEYIPPLVHNNQIIVSYSSGQIFALNIQDGSEQWEINLGNPDDVGLPNFEAAGPAYFPIIDDDKLYIASHTGKLVKLDMSNGNALWQIKVNDVQSMSLIGNSLFVINNARQIAAISLVDGRVKWVADLMIHQNKKKDRALSFMAPFILNNEGKLYLNILTRNGEMYFFDILSEERNLPASPKMFVVSDNVKYFGATEKYNLCLITDKKLIGIEEH
jgi:outer membrane protein assembly factor BamB